MIKTLFTYQISDDSTDQQNEKRADTLQLNLIKAQDESNLIILPSAENNRQHAAQNHYQINEEVVNNERQDTIDASLKITNVPVRKVYQETPVIKKEEKMAFQPLVSNKENTTLQVLLLLLAIGLIGFAKAFSSNRLSQITKSLFSYHAAEEVVREEKVFFHRVNFSLFIVFVITLSLCLNYLLSKNYLSTDYLVNYLYIVGIIILIYGIKFLSLSILSVIFSSTQMLTSYVYNILIYSYLSAFLLLPCTVLLYFSSFNPGIIINYIIIPGLVIIFGSRLIRLFIIGRENNVLNFYIILYICTLEILPLVVLGKIFIFK